MFRIAASDRVRICLPLSNDDLALILGHFRDAPKNE